MAEKLLRELIEEAPEISPALWDEASNLFRRHASLQSVLGYLLAKGYILSQSLSSLSVSTEEGREQFNQTKGAVLCYTNSVGDLCDQMGDYAIADERANAEAQREERGEPEPKRRTSERRYPRTKRAKAAPVKKAKTTRRRK